MQRFLRLLGLALAANVAHTQMARAQDAPPIIIGIVEITSSANIGGQISQSQNLNFSDIKVIGTWMRQDKAGNRGYLYVSDAREDELKDKKLVASLGGKLFDVQQIRSAGPGEIALVINKIDAAAAAILKQNNFHAPKNNTLDDADAATEQNGFEAPPMVPIEMPLNKQLQLRWQIVDNAKLRLTTTSLASKRAGGNLQLAPDNAQLSLRLTRNGQPLELLPPKISKSAGQPANFELLSAGARWQRDSELNRYADISQPGHYQVEINYQLPARDSTAPDETIAPLEFAQTTEFDVAKR